MKTPIQININKPCREHFGSFSTTEKGGFCATCQKEVIDFSTMPTSEILAKLQPKSKGLCGRFKAGHVNRPFIIPLRRNLGMAGIALMSLTLSPVAFGQSINTATPKIVQAQQLGQYVVKGTVVDDQNIPLMGVNVVLKGSDEGVATDFDGKFEFSRPLDEGAILVFSYIGFEPKEYKVQASESEIQEVVITFEYSDVMLMGEVSIDEIYSSKDHKKGKKSKSGPKK